MKNQIIPEIAVYDKVNEEKEQKKVYQFKSGNRIRKNNRKTTRSRKIQVVTMISNSWPPVISIREIKTNN